MLEQVTPIINTYTEKLQQSSRYSAHYCARTLSPKPISAAVVNGASADCSHRNSISDNRPSLSALTEELNRSRKSEVDSARSNRSPFIRNNPVTDASVALPSTLPTTAISSTPPETSSAPVHGNRRLFGPAQQVQLSQNSSNASGARVDKPPTDETENADEHRGMKNKGVRKQTRSAHHSPHVSSSQRPSQPHKRNRVYSSPPASDTPQARHLPHTPLRTPAPLVFTQAMSTTHSSATIAELVNRHDAETRPSSRPTRIAPMNFKPIYPTLYNSPTSLNSQSQTHFQTSSTRHFSSIFGNKYV